MPKSAIVQTRSIDDCVRRIFLHVDWTVDDLLNVHDWVLTQSIDVYRKCEGRFETALGTLGGKPYSGWTQWSTSMQQHRIREKSFVLVEKLNVCWQLEAQRIVGDFFFSSIFSANSVTSTVIGRKYSDRNTVQQSLQISDKTTPKQFIERIARDGRILVHRMDLYDHSFCPR